MTEILKTIELPVDSTLLFSEDHCLFSQKGKDIVFDIERSNIGVHVLTVVHTGDGREIVEFRKDGGEIRHSTLAAVGD